MCFFLNHKTLVLDLNLVERSINYIQFMIHLSYLLTTFLLICTFAFRFWGCCFFYFYKEHMLFEIK